MPEITYADAVARVEKIIEKFGAAHVYDKSSSGMMSCTYERDGEPSCIVGQVLADAGATIDQLKVLDKGGWNEGADRPFGPDELGDGSGISEYGVLRYLDVEGFNLTRDAKMYLGHLQRAQDGGVAWGEAHEQAKSETERDAAHFGRTLE